MQVEQEQGFYTALQQEVRTDRRGRQLRSLCRGAQGLTPTEVQAVKGYLSGSFAINLQTPESLAGQLASAAFYGLPDNYLETYLTKLRAVTPTDANRIARKYFAPDSLSLILVAPAAKVAGQLKGIGTIESRTLDSVGQK